MMMIRQATVTSDHRLVAGLSSESQSVLVSSSPSSWDLCSRQYLSAEVTRSVATFEKTMKASPDPSWRMLIQSGIPINSQGQGHQETTRDAEAHSTYRFSFFPSAIRIRNAIGATSFSSDSPVAFER